MSRRVKEEVGGRKGGWSWGEAGEELQHYGARAPKVTASCVSENLQSFFTKLTQCAMRVDFLWKSAKGWILRLNSPYFVVTRLTKV